MSPRRSRRFATSGHYRPVPTRTPRLRRRRRRSPKRLLPILFALGVAMLLALVGGFAAVAAVARSEIEALPTICSLEDAEERPLGETSYVYAADDTFLGAIRANVYRQQVTLQEISPWLRAATVAMEDRRFYEHDGVDYQAIVRAAYRNLEEQEVVEGGSTITQQLVRSLYLTPDQTLERKRQEACLALNLEERWTKDEILAGYLNRVYYGNRSYGAEAAAQTYFSRRASQLGPAQAALIAGLAQAPSLYDPFRHPERTLQRRNEVLRAMLETGAIGQQAYEGLIEVPLNLRRGHLFTTQREPYFFEYVRRQLVEAYGERVVRQGGLRVYTTVQPRYQQLARRAMAQELGEPDDPASAVVSIDHETGAIRAMTSFVPGARPDFNLAVQGRRQTGSAFKTFVFAEAVRRGADPFTTMYNSQAFEHDLGQGNDPRIWSPTTFDGTEYGPSNLIQATLRSDNIVYAKLTLDLGPGSVARMARDLGITTQLDPVPSIGLGSNDVSVLEMASAYATLAAGGVYREPFAIRKVERRDGEVDAQRWGPSEPRHVLPDGVAYFVTRILEQNVLEGTGGNARLSRPAAGKTGTTDRFTDAWFVGYSPELTTAVWVGYPNRTTSMTNVRGIRVTGGSFPASIWGRFMEPALEGEPVQEWALPTTAPELVEWRGNRRWAGPSNGDGDGDGDGNGDGNGNG